MRTCISRCRSASLMAVKEAVKAVKASSGAGAPFECTSSHGIISCVLQSDICGVHTRVFLSYAKKILGWIGASLHPTVQIGFFEGCQKSGVTKFDEGARFSSATCSGAVWGTTLWKYHNSM